MSRMLGCLHFILYWSYPIDPHFSITPALLFQLIDTPDNCGNLILLDPSSPLFLSCTSRLIYYGESKSFMGTLLELGCPTRVRKISKQSHAKAVNRCSGWHVCILTASLALLLQWSIIWRCWSKYLARYAINGACNMAISFFRRSFVLSLDQALFCGWY